MWLLIIIFNNLELLINWSLVCVVLGCLYMWYSVYLIYLFHFMLLCCSICLDLYMILSHCNLSCFTVCVFFILSFYIFVSWSYVGVFDLRLWVWCSFCNVLLCIFFLCVVCLIGVYSDNYMWYLCRILLCDIYSVSVDFMLYLLLLCVVCFRFWLYVVFYFIGSILYSSFQ